MLPNDVLCRIIEKLTLHDKIRLQLVSRKLHDLLMRPPSGEGLWGECDLSAEFSKFVVQENSLASSFIDAGVRR